MLTGLLAAMYLRAVTVLRRRGWTVPRGQQALWWAGTLSILVALCGPPDALSDDLFSAHMGQHLLIADFAAPLLLMGARTPVLVFLLPRDLLVPLARTRWLRTFFAKLRKPLVAVPIWIVVLYAWHFGLFMNAALRNPAVHALQHECFFVASVLVWWPVVEPQRGRSSGELWKIGQILGQRLAGMFLGMAFILMRVQAYPWYAERAHRHGIGVILDQQIGGGLMFLTDLIVMFGSLA